MKKRSIWLIAWEASSKKRQELVEGPRIIAFLDGRKSDTTIREIVFGVYLASGILNIHERAYYGLTDEGKQIIRRDDEFGCIKCGLNPWVVARHVEHFEITGIDEEAFLLSWNQPIYRFPQKEGSTPVLELVSKEERIDQTNRRSR